MANKLITVATLDHINQASLMKEWLDMAGIESYLLDHGISLEAASQLEGQIELQVCDTDASKALELIGNMAEKPFRTPDGTDNSFIKKIVVPINFSPVSLNAACYAAHLAQQKGAEITLIHIYFNPATDLVASDHFYSFPTDIAGTLNEIIADATEMMDDFRKKLENYTREQDLSGISINTELIGGIAEEAVLDFAVAGKYDLLIVGVRGKESAENWLGSFTVDLINKSRIPVLAVPEDIIYKKTMFKRVMYATNFDKSDGKAIRELIKIAKPLETHISIVHIDDTMDNPYINYDLAHFKEKYIGDVDLVTMDFNLIVNKNLAVGIENFITEHEIDLISVTAHKRNLITSLFMPSVTKALLFRLDIPILIFHA